MILFADTNVLLDLYKTDLLKMFLSLDHVSCIEETMFEDELLEPKEIKRVLLENGLQTIEMDDEEFSLARRVYEEKPKLSFYDCVAYAVAKCRGWDILTGDKRLRAYAQQHDVVVHGLLWAMEECERTVLGLIQVLLAWNIIEKDERIRIPDKERFAANKRIILMIKLYQHTVKREVVQYDLMMEIAGIKTVIEIQKGMRYRYG